MEQTLAQLKARIKEIDEIDMSPEILWCDGEATKAQVQVKVKALDKEKAQIKKKIAEINFNTCKCGAPRHGELPSACESPREEVRLEDAQADQDLPGIATVMAAPAKKVLVVSREGNRTLVQGNGTYDARVFLKEKGFRWNGYAKAWTSYADVNTVRVLLDELTVKGFRVLLTAQAPTKAS